MYARRLRLATILSAAALAALPASAAQRTFVASVGLDTNSCNLVSPCRTFTRALTQTDANGEVLVLDSAGYGAFTINQSVSIIAPDGIYAGISVFPGQHGVTISAGTVVLRGLTINGQGGDDGIRIESAGNVYVEKVTISNTGNDTADAGIRVFGTAANARVFVTDTTVRGTAGSGITIQANATVLVDRSRIEGNAFRGIFGLAGGGTLNVTDSLIARNTSEGISVAANAAGTWEVTVARSTIEGNGFAGVLISPGGTSGASRVYRVAVTDSVVRNNSGIGILLSAPLTETLTGVVGNNRVVGHTETGIGCSGDGNTTLVAEQNEVLGNAAGFVQALNCTFKSMGNNTVENNNTEVSGTITSATLR